MSVGVEAETAPTSGSGGEPLLSVRGVAISFRGLRALDGVSFDVPAGGITAVIGPNGAGKTTLFNCISGIYGGEGVVQLGGEDLAGLPPPVRAARGLERTFQTPALVEHATVLDNVMLGAHGRTRSGLVADLLRTPSCRREERVVRSEALAVLEQLGLVHLAGVLAADLAHGNRRRVEIARALLARPRLLMLDEPAAGIGSVEARDFGELLTRLADELDLTLLLVEHNVSLVMSVARQVVVLDFGALIADGPPAAVRADPRVVAAYLGQSE